MTKQATMSLGCFGSALLAAPVDAEGRVLAEAEGRVLVDAESDVHDHPDRIRLLTI